MLVAVKEHGSAFLDSALTVIWCLIQSLSNLICNTFSYVCYASLLGYSALPVYLLLQMTQMGNAKGNGLEDKPHLVPGWREFVASKAALSCPA